MNEGTGPFISNVIVIMPRKSADDQTSVRPNHSTQACCVRTDGHRAMDRALLSTPG